MRHLLTAALLVLAAPASAATIVLDFEEEIVGNIDDGGDEEGHISVECSCVFYDSGDLEVFNANLGPGGSGGHVLANTGGYPGIPLVFLTPVTSLSLQFFDWGGPAVHLPPGAPVVLEVYWQWSLVGEARMLTDGNGLLDQTIAISGVGLFDRAFFRFPGQWEAVDNVTFETVPEPGTLGLGALACAFLLGRRRSRPGASA